ncbi:protein SpAN-like [Liolophura sinensis]|uniref:protein SpAN-like n=1 Tax=Liolophura sinensis TaxID=3198878 RepID=UPI0031586771
MNFWLAVISVAVVVVSARPRNSNEVSKRGVNRNCGNLDFWANSGFISTPNYPSNYGDDTTCVYTIQPSNLSSQFYVDFYTCDCFLEDHSICSYDSIRFGNNGTKNCGNVSFRRFSVMSTNGKVEVIFDTDGSVNDRGCKIAYSTQGNLPNCPNSNISIGLTPAVNYSTTSFNYSIPWWNNTTPSFNYSTPWWNNTTPSFNYSTPWWNNTTPSFNYSTPWWNNTTPSFNYSTPWWNTTTAAPSNGSIYDLLNIMYSEAYAVENAFEEYRHAVSNVINRLMP